MSILGALGSIVGGAGGFLLGGPAGAMAGASVLGGLGGSIDNQNAVNSANEANLASAQKQMDFQERMSNSSYQRASMDMQKAGINPMLAYSQGGASTPSGAAAQSQAAQTGDMAMRGVSGALDAFRLGNEIKNMNADVALKTANRITQEAVGRKELSNARTAEAQARAAEAMLPSQLKKADWDTKLGDYDAIVDRAYKTSGVISNATDLVRLLPKSLGSGYQVFKKHYDKMVNDSGSHGIKVP